MPGAGKGGPPGATIARLDWAWLRFAPLTLSGLVAVGAVVGGGFNLLRNLGVELADSSTIEDAVDGAGAFLLSRGLLTTRSVSIEEQRLRGVEVVEPMILRWGRGARASAIASGLASEGGFGNSGSVLPPAPRAEAHRLARVMLAEPALPAPPVDLHRHPAAALRRRLVRRLLLPAVVTAGLAAIEPTRGWAWLAAVILVPVAVASAVDAYRNLGHRLVGTCLVTRDGAVTRRTVALRRSGVIGWTVS
nr:hypothetical protein [Micromonospora sp. DSM 115978]